MILTIADRWRPVAVAAAIGALGWSLILAVANYPVAAAVTAGAGAAILLGLVAEAQHRITTLHRELAVAHTDPVTGLPTRRVAEHHLHAADPRASLAVALIDVDDMHGINDRHSHHGGDAYLAAVADRLRAALAPGDLAARLGGDEFVVLSYRTPPVLAGALATALTTTVTIGAGRILPVRVSIGLAWAGAGVAPHAALGRADLAMYTAKRSGGGITIYDPARDGHPDPAGTRPPVRRRDQRRR